jgi:hypothetical protein
MTELSIGPSDLSDLSDLRVGPSCQSSPVVPESPGVSESPRGVRVDRRCQSSPVVPEVA